MASDELQRREGQISSFSNLQPATRAHGSSAEPRIYHERQEMLLCGLHALNALLQGPFFDEISLASLAQDLDKREREVMAEAGMDTAEFQQFAAQESANVAMDGNFSIQVLTMALNIFGLTVLNLDSPAAADAKGQPQQEQAFICHLKAHWFVIRKVGGAWYDVNSVHAAPKALSDFYLSAFLTSLKEEGWTVFVVRGIFPTGCPNDPTERSRWFTPAEAKEALAAAEEQERRESAALAAAQLAESLPQNGAPWRIWQGGAGAGAGRRSGTGLSAGLGHTWGAAGAGQRLGASDGDLDKALAMSLAEAEEQQLLSCMRESLSNAQAGPGLTGNGGRGKRPIEEPASLHGTSSSQPGGSSSGVGVAAQALSGEDCHQSHSEALQGPGPSGGQQRSNSEPGPSEPSAVVPIATQPISLPVSAAAVADAPTVADVPAVMDKLSAVGAADEFEVAVRLPGGQRLVRRFRREECVEALEVYVKMQLGGDRSFVLSEVGPAGKSLTDGSLTLHQAGVQDKTTFILRYK